MDPKYANLPGIAINEPDVYESEELPESEQSDILPETKEEPLNIDIEVINCDAFKCISRFHMKHLDGANPDLSDRMNRGYRSAFEICTDGQVETPVQKLARLQAETQELVSQLDDVKNDLNAGESNTKEYVTQMQCLQKRLDGIDTTTSFTGTKGGMENIESILSKKYKDKTIIPTADDFNFKIYSTEKNTEKLISLDQRLNKIETLLGAHITDSLSELTEDINCCTIKEAISMLNAQLKMLDVDTLSELQSRVSQMNIDDESSVSETCCPNTNVDDLYVKVKKWNSLVDSVPLLTDRLTSLKGVHKQAGDLSNLIINVDRTQKQITSQLSDNKELLTSVESVLTRNMSTIKENCLSIEKRIETLEKKKKK